jgi:hypothetical protein
MVLESDQPVMKFMRWELGVASRQNLSCGQGIGGLVG